MARYEDINFSPPAGVRAEAQKGLDWRREFGRGGTEIGIARGRDLSNGTKISPDTARRMKAYFDRHEVDKKGEGFSPGEPGFPSNGRIAWALWGGNFGYSWSQKLVRQMNSEDERSFEMNIIERRSVEADNTAMLGIEVRACPQTGTKQNWLVGYAAKFGVDSLKMDDFYERIDPGAFRIVTERRGRKSSLDTRALFNHDPSQVLGRFPTTLKMNVDATGLRYEVLMPESRSDLVESIQRGDIRGSSFSFVLSPDGDSWDVEEGRSVRTLKSIASLIDVGPVTYPAYPDANVAVARRSLQQFQSRSQSDMQSKKSLLQKFLRERSSRTSR